MKNPIAAIRRLQPKNLVRYVPKPWAGQNKYLRERRIKRKKQAISLLGGQCLDCGVSFPDHPEVYDFDHARGTKKYNVSSLFTSHTWKRIAAEIKKCDLVCSNCHRIRTAQRAGWAISKTGVSDTSLENLE